MNILTREHIKKVIPLLAQLAAKSNMTEKEAVELIRLFGYKPTPPKEKE